MDQDKALIGQILDYIQLNLNKKRYQHIIRVSETAEQLATKWHIDQKDILIASLLHDATKQMDKDKTYRILRTHGLDDKEIRSMDISLWHGFTAARLAEEKFNITEINIIKAIEHHTFGHPDMSDLEKIIFLADKIEPDRTFDGIVQIREMAYSNLDQAILMFIDSNILYLIKQKKFIHPITIETRNDYLKTNQ